VQQGQTAGSLKRTNPLSWGREGILIALKVLALLVAYSAFVWVTMIQLERRYLEPNQGSTPLQIGSAGPVDPVPGASEGLAKPLSSVVEPPRRRMLPAQHTTVPQADEEAGKRF
jgi:hypothetical protein